LRSRPRHFSTGWLAGWLASQSTQEWWFASTSFSLKRFMLEKQPEMDHPGETACTESHHHLDADVIVRSCMVDNVADV